ncbi:MAG: alpha-2-macroglobulin family protein, partial [Spirochaetales bacterium]|nr:alpha-2-macroglobulin family protein [Spirochaetales bacterium]
MKITVPRFFFLLFIFLLFSCEKAKEPEQTALPVSAEVPVRETGPLITPLDIDFLPTEPILTDSEVLSESPVSEVDLSALLEAEDREMGDREEELRASIDYSSLTTNYFDADAVDTGALRAPESVGALKIVDFGPVGQLPIEMRRPSIYVQFNQPMVPVSKLGEPMRSHDILKISPEVEGTYRWYGTKTLSFEPDAPIHRQSRYRVSISSGASSIYGRVLGQSFDFTIESEAPEILSLSFGPGDDLYDASLEVPPGHSSRILLTFNQTIDADGLADFLILQDGEGREYPVKVSSPDTDEYYLDENFLRRSALVEPEETLPLESSFTLSVLEGFRTKEGASPTAEVMSRDFSTVSAFRFSRQSDRSWSFPYDPEGVMNPLYLSFTHPVDPDSLDGKISVSFEGIQMADHLKVWGDTVRIANLPVEYESSYQVTLMPGIRDIYGREADLDSDNEHGTRVIQVEVPAAISYSYFPGWEGLAALEAQFDPAVVYEFQNIDQGSFRINGEEQDLALDQAPRNQAVYNLVDLKPYMNEEGYGRVNLNWNFTERRRTWNNEIREYEKKRNMDVQVTDMGITTRFAYNKILVWVNSLSTGDSVSGARINIEGPGGFSSAVTNADGLALVSLAPGEFRQKFYSTRRNRYDFSISAEKGMDRADLNVTNTHYTGRFGISSSRPEFALDSIPRVFLFSDRGIYRPGETLTFRGVDWNQRLGEFSPYQGDFTLSIMKREGYRKKAITSWRGTTTSSGGFFDTWTITDDMDPGDYYIRYERGGRSVDEPFQVANFRRLNFQVQLRAPERTFFLGDTIAVPLEASYLAGGPLAGGEVSSFWTRKPLEFRPSGEKWKYWTFGPRGWEQEKNLSSDSSKLSLQGKAGLEIETTEQSLKGKAYRYVVEATVEDVDRQAISASTSAVVHPASWYIAARTGSASASRRGSRYVAVDDDLQFSLAQVGPGGESLTHEGVLTLEMIKGSWQAAQQKNVGSRINTRYEWVEESLFTREIPWEEGMAEYHYTPESSGSYRLRIKAEDSRGREILTDISFYASGGSWVRWAGGNREDITLEPEQDLYFPGDTARILVKSPLERGRYLLTIEREGILEERFIDLDPSNPIIEIPVKEEWIPVMHITLAGFLPRGDLPESYHDPDFGKPRGIFGAAALNISTQTRELDLEILPDKAVYRPGEEAEITIRVTENGRPVEGAEVSYLAVDRGILDLINYHIPNPLSYFYSRTNFLSYTAGDDSRRLLLNPVTYETSNLRGGDGEESKLQRRDDFTPLAVFEPYLLTDSTGTVRVNLQWPDTLTTYRSTAIVLKDQKIGYSEDELFVRNPLNVRAALPRQMRVRDTSFAGVVISNIDSSDHEVTVKISSDGLGLPGETEKTVTVPAGRAYEVPFVIEARSEGESEVLFTILS